VATVDNIDFPSRPGLPAAQLRAELDAIVARAAALHLNALVFQVRPAGDAFYASRLEPWSEWLTGAQGEAPDGGLDPLAYVIEQAHAAGLQLHAWFNPYRASHPAGKSPAAASHVRTVAPQLVVRYGKYDWMDPGEPLAAKWSLAVIQDVVKRYDVDGVHIDDYFYPYPEKAKPDDKQPLPFPDDASFARYRKGGGKLARDDWRRANIDTFVQRMREVVHDAKPWVQVGISPFGIARPGVPKGIQAGIDQYGDLFADVPRWLREGWLDYLAPQLYWPIDQTAQSFPRLLDYWHGVNPKRRAIWPGLYTGKILAGKAPWRPSELTDQLALVRKAVPESGHVHYSFKALRSDAAAVAGALRTLYAEPVLAPAMPWLEAAAPAAPAGARDGGAATWTVAATTRFVVVRVQRSGRWHTHRIVGGAVGRCEVPPGAVALIAVNAVGVCSPATML
jgi:uncharacterized lipoprotein YddW (UPF0748 family)